MVMDPRTFRRASPGGAVSNLCTLSRNPRTSSGGVRCFDLKKFMADVNEYQEYVLGS